MTDHIYDIESLPNFFSLTIMSVDTLTPLVFEVSERRNDLPQLVTLVIELRDSGARMVGFNNVGYDYVMLHFIMQNAHKGLNAFDIYTESQRIISTPWNMRFTVRIAPWEVIVPQVDLFLIHRFDAATNSTSLKRLEFNMQSDSVEELPLSFDKPVAVEQIPVILDYNLHDVKETYNFYVHSLPMINFRDELSAKYGENFTNYNDTTIGKNYFIMQLEQHSPGICYSRVNGRKFANQTLRPTIDIGEILFPYISFKRPEFQRILEYYRTQTITETKAVFEDLSCEIFDLTYHFGAGGIHASVESQTVKADADHIILDIDVASYYPSLAIANGLYPRHLGEQFCTIYAALKSQRMDHKKGSSTNAMLKLALNGVYGMTNNEYSPFYDPQYTMAITINGQLLLCMLAEMLLPIRDLTIVQVNTDGLTLHLPREEMHQVEAACDWWQRLTLLTLEYVEYSRMMIRDVNNYVAEDIRDNVKKVGTYKDLGATECGGNIKKGKAWSGNHSAMIVHKAATYALLNECHVREFIRAHQNPHDFTLCTKLQRTSYLTHGENRVQNTTRYYISTDGDYLHKRMPPLKRTGLTEFRDFRINAGFKTTVCNQMTDFNWGTVNYDWYIEEAMKLVRAVR